MSAAESHDGKREGKGRKSCQMSYMYMYKSVLYVDMYGLLSHSIHHSPHAQTCNYTCIYCRRDMHITVQ